MQSHVFCARESSLINVEETCFSNHIYKDFNSLPDLIFIFNAFNSHTFLKQLKNVGLITIATTNDPKLIVLVDYPIILNIFSYFINYFILNSYSQLILLNKK